MRLVSRGLEHLVLTNNLGELRWYAGCHCSRDTVSGLLTISQSFLMEKTVNKFRMNAGRDTPLSTDVFLQEFDNDEPDWV